MNKLEEEFEIVIRQKKVYLKKMELDKNNADEYREKIAILTEREKELAHDLGID